VDLAEEKWQKAERDCDILLKENPQDLAGHYYAGIVKRAQGVEAAGLPAWKRAREHFVAVLARDSLYRDILYLDRTPPALQPGRGAL
jgi:hypothetical protein